MPRKGEKLLQRARQTRAGWTAQDLIALYEAYGFRVRQGRGSHVVVSHPQFEGLTALIPVHAKELSKPYVATAVKNIERAIELESEPEEDDE